MCWEYVKRLEWTLCQLFQQESVGVRARHWVLGVTQFTGVLASSWGRWQGNVWAVICTLQVRIHPVGKGSVMPSDLKELCSALFSFQRPVQFVRNDFFFFFFAAEIPKVLPGEVQATRV